MFYHIECIKILYDLITFYSSWNPNQSINFPVGMTPSLKGSCHKSGCSVAVNFSLSPVSLVPHSSASDYLALYTYVWLSSVRRFLKHVLTEDSPSTVIQWNKNVFSRRLNFLHLRSCSRRASGRQFHRSVWAATKFYLAVCGQMTWVVFTIL